MSYNTWGVQMHEIEEKKVAELVKAEYEAFIAELEKYDVILDSYAQYFDTSDMSYIDDAFYELEDGNELGFEEISSILDESFKTLNDAFEARTGAKLWLYCPTADIEDGEERTYWTISNYFIVNPAISKETIEAISFAEVVCGG